MTYSSSSPGSLARPRSDGSRVWFEITDGDTIVACAISRAALLDLSDKQHFKATELLQCFEDARDQVEALARAQLRERPDRVTGTLGIWAIDDPAPGQPADGTPPGPARHTARKPTPAPSAQAAGPSPVQFEIRDGVRRVLCRISDDALDQVSGLPGPSTSILRRKSFDRFRTLIDAAAKLKLKTLAADFAGPVMLTAADLRCVQAGPGVPAFGSQTRSGSRAAASNAPGTAG